MKINKKQLRDMILGENTPSVSNKISSSLIESNLIKNEWKLLVSESRAKDNSRDLRETWLKIANLNENLEDESEIDRMLLRTVDILKLVYDAAKEEFDQGNREGENRRFLFFMLEVAGDSADSTGQDIAGKRQSIINAAEFFRAYKDRVPSAGHGIVDEIISFVEDGQSQQLA